MTESISTPNALVQTTNGKRFYVNSGIVAVIDSNTAVISIDNIGERDIIFKINPIVTSVSTDNMYLTVRNNSIDIYQATFDTQRSVDVSSPIHFIFAANTSLEILFANQTSTPRNAGVSCYGKYLSM